MTLPLLPVPLPGMTHGNMFPVVKAIEDYFEKPGKLLPLVRNLVKYAQTCQTKSITERRVVVAYCLALIRDQKTKEEPNERTAANLYVNVYRELVRGLTNEEAFLESALELFPNKQKE